ESVDNGGKPFISFVNVNTNAVVNLGYDKDDGTEFKKYVNDLKGTLTSKVVFDSNNDYYEDIDDKKLCITDSDKISGFVNTSLKMAIIRQNGLNWRILSFYTTQPYSYDKEMIQFVRNLTSTF
ncbi:hypothetical protein CYR55_23155, partial [Chimaeribacter californicus]